MRLSEFLHTHADAILDEWDACAAGYAPAAPYGNPTALRGSAAEVLASIANELDTPHRHVQRANSAGAAARHGAVRLRSGFSIDQVLAEYRALRSSVLRHWTALAQPASPTDAADMMRFHDAIDQALAQTVARYSAMVSHSQHLFLGVLGHDLRNPLNTTVMAAGYLMRLPELAGEHAQAIARIQRSGVRMGRLVDNLIDYTRTHLGTALPLSMTKSNMGMICRDAVEDSRRTHPERAIYFSTGPQLDGIWDESRMSQVASILLENALQHGSQRDPVSLSIDGSPSDVLLGVHNKGAAIAPEDMATMFDPMVRFATQNGGPENHTSLGIGLYIARAIVQAHHGDISVASDASFGTTFRVRLPRRPPARGPGST